MNPIDRKFFKAAGYGNAQIEMFFDYENHTPESLFELAKGHLIEIANDLEQGAKEFVKLGEDGISNIVATALNRHLFLAADRESNSRGHVDLTIKAPSIQSSSSFSYKGEAKIWKGEKKVLDTCNQIHEYLTGREVRGFILFYFRTKSCDSLFTKYIEAVTETCGGELVGHEKRFFTTRHTHESGAELFLDHYALHLPQPPRISSSDF